MGDARAVGHRGNRRPVLFLGQLVAEVRVEEVAERDRDAERGQDTAVDIARGQVDDEEEQAAEDDDVEHHVGSEAEKCVQVAGDPERDLDRSDLSCSRRGCVHRFPPTGVPAAPIVVSRLSELVTQPKMPPWALIIRRA